MTIAMPIDAAALEPIQPSTSVKWMSRVLGWACWAAIAMFGYGAAMTFLNLAAPEAEGGNLAMPSTVFYFSVAMADPAANDAIMAGMRADWLNRIVGLAPFALIVWALLSARASIIGVGRGEYFARSTVLGLRNLALAVLLYQTVAPILTILPKILYVARAKGDRMAELSASIGLTPPIALVLVFAGVVALVSTVMAHAARLADENRQFV